MSLTRKNPLFARQIIVPRIPNNRVRLKGPRQQIRNFRNLRKLAKFGGGDSGSQTGKTTPNFYSQNLNKTKRNQIVFTIFRLKWFQTDVRLDRNQSENGKYNLTSG